MITHANSTSEPKAAWQRLIVLPHGGAHPSTTFPFLSGFDPLSHLLPPHFTVPLLSLPMMQSLSPELVMPLAAARASCIARCSAALSQSQSQLLSMLIKPKGSV